MHRLLVWIRVYSKKIQSYKPNNSYATKLNASKWWGGG